jgi:pyrroline-5-carboxylate reductase
MKEDIKVKSEDSGLNSLDGVHLAFIGTGVMAEAIIAGLLRQKLVKSDQIIGSHPRANRREELAEKYGIRMTAGNRDAVIAQPSDQINPSVVILAVKPQRIIGVLHELKDAIRPDQLVVSIVAGAKMETIGHELNHPAVVRAMPNTPAQIGHGITAWTATPEVSAAQAHQVETMLAALGRTVHVENERQIDMATALSATGPTYIFLVMEALIDAGVHLGFSRHVAEELVIEMMLGSVLFAKESEKHPAALRNMVTSPGGTSAAAIYQMEKGSLRTVLSKAVWAAYQRAVSLGEEPHSHPSEKN